MKKKYLSPTCNLEACDTSDFMVTSLDNTSTNEQVITPDYSEPAPDEFTSRRNVWNDED